MDRGYLTATEATALFRQALSDELGLATATRFDRHPSDHGGRTPRVFEAVYRIAARLLPDAVDAPPDLFEAIAGGLSCEDRRAVRLMLRVVAPHRAIAAEATAALEQVGAPVDPATVRDGSA